MVNCEEEHYTKWIATVFGECVHTPKEKASFYIGLSSILCWLVAQVPQLIQNYRKQSATALSVLFLVEWLCGDGFNLLGAIITRQLPTQISTAVYFLLMDIVLTLQWGYYTIKKRIARRELLPLIKDDTGLDEINPTNESSVDDDENKTIGTEEDQQQQHDANEEEDNTNKDTNIDLGDESYEHPTKKSRGLLSSDEEYRTENNDNNNYNNNDNNNTRGFKSFTVLPFLFLGGILLILPYFNELNTIKKDPTYVTSPSRRNLLESGKGGLPSTPVDWTGYAIGIISSLFYLGSRIPQIIKNYRRKSTKGLSFLLNTFAALGNITYGISIFLYSVEGEFLLAKAPWLAGSLGTLIFDATILTQMVLYRNAKEVDEYENVKEEIIEET